MEDMEIEIPFTQEPIPPPLKQNNKTKIIKNGNLEIEVINLKKSKTKLDSLLRRFDGYYGQEKFNDYGHKQVYSLTLRIPNIKFDSILTSLEKGIGTLKSKSISLRDVTEEYVDLNIRLDNSLTYLNQYQNVLTKAKSIKDILEVREKIRLIEIDIESKKGRLKYLNDKVKYSTLNIEVYQDLAIQKPDKESFFGRVKTAFNNGIQGFLHFIILTINLWPFLLLFLFAFIGRKRINTTIVSTFNRNKKQT